MTKRCDESDCKYYNQPLVLVEEYPDPVCKSCAIANEYTIIEGEKEESKTCDCEHPIEDHYFVTDENENKTRLMCQQCGAQCMEQDYLLLKPHIFFDAMMEKFLQVAKEKNRSLKPWDDYDIDFLYDRLEEEWNELSVAWDNYEDDILNGLSRTVDGIQDELLDVANFAMFLWLKLQLSRPKKEQRGWLKPILDHVKQEVSTWPKWKQEKLREWSEE